MDRGGAEEEDEMSTDSDAGSDKEEDQGKDSDLEAESETGNQAEAGAGAGVGAEPPDKETGEAQEETPKEGQVEESHSNLLYMQEKVETMQKY